jgi:hypothetical protein
MPDPAAGFLDPHPRNGAGLGFMRCGTCAGNGFRIVGAIPDERFVRCSSCGGSGQFYLDQPEVSAAARGWDLATS